MIWNIVKTTFKNKLFIFIRRIKTMPITISHEKKTNLLNISYIRLHKIL